MAPVPNSRSRLVLAICGVTALYWLALFVATHIPMRGRPAVYKDFDKGEHLAAFAGLALLLCATGGILGQPLSRLYPIVLATVGAYGAIDELTQLLVPTRAGDWRDWLADMAGALAGVTAFGVIRTITLAVGKWGATVRAG